MTKTQFNPLRALRAAKTLAQNPDDLPQVFTIIESLSGSTLARVAERMAKSETGSKILNDKPDVVDVLTDHAGLERLPEGTLGRAYLDFLRRENISAAGIRAASNSGMEAQDTLPAPIDYVHRRLRDTHDLWHAAVGYHGDVLGETALLGFTFAQTHNPAIALILAIGLLKTRNAPEARRTILDGYKRGKKAAWLADQPWETMLAMPLNEVRQKLGLGDPPVYTPVRTAELRAQGLVSALA
ncbi:MAG: hypothetical protein IPK82_42090 [Polyangiaceae bacterium]|nr:hypothetical protein [Polyangiaceae bacterium]